MSAWDAIVIGGGHNGLVAGAYLARAGARTVVLEARSKTGGAAATDAPWPEAPEIKVTRLSYVMSLMPPRIIRDLDLERHGYKLFPMGPAYQAWPDGRSLTIYDDDARRNHEQIARFSKRDADAMPQWDAWLEGLAAVLGPLLTQTPQDRLAPAIGPARAAPAGLALPGPGRAHRRRRDPAHDHERRRPAGRLVRVRAGQGEPGRQRGDRHLGRARLARHRVCDGPPLDRRRGRRPPGQLGLPRGRHGGGRRRHPPLGAPARRHRADRRPGGAGAGRRRPGHRGGAGGRRGAAGPGGGHRHPPQGHLPGAGRPGRAAGRLRHRHRALEVARGVVKINLALAELPDFTADPGTEVGEHHTGSVEMALSVDYIERAFQDAKQGRGATRPFSDGCIPTVFDKTLAPEGIHVMSLFTQWCPHEWSEAPHTEELEAYADRMIDCYAELAPNLKSAILHREVIGPWQMEQEWGLVGGNIFHGELSADQLFHMRPAPGYADYRSPIAGLYQASSATHGGGGVCGIPGWQAVRAVMADRRKAKHRR